MKLCTCNQCGIVYEDMNPQVDAKDYPDGLGYEPLIKLYPDITDLSTGYWGCPKCCTDSFLSDTVDEATIEDLEKSGHIPWVLTDADTGQYGRRLSTYKYEFKERERNPTIIDLERYSWKEICDCCEAYYPNMDELFSTYAAMSTWIIAECLFEMNITKT